MELTLSTQKRLIDWLMTVERFEIEYVIRENELKLDVDKVERGLTLLSLKLRASVCDDNGNLKPFVVTSSVREATKWLGEHSFNDLEREMNHAWWVWHDINTLNRDIIKLYNFLKIQNTL